MLVARRAGLHPCRGILNLVGLDLLYRAGLHSIDPAWLVAVTVHV